MDGLQFDALLRLCATTPSRRAALRLLTMTILGAALRSLLGLGDAVEVSAMRHARARQHPAQKTHSDRFRAAKKKKRKSKKKAVAPPATSSPSCVPSCGVCQSCVGGACVTVADGTNCGACKECRGGVCVNLPENTLCPDGYCQAGVCTPCGGAGQTCCPSGGYFGCDTNTLECGGDNICHPCGGEGQSCCPLLSTYCILPLECCFGACFPHEACRF